MNGMYNDLTFRMGDRILNLMEAQNMWSVNILVRELLYLSNLYNEYITEKKLNVYGSRKIHLPKPELFVLYTGEPKKRGTVISVTEEFF